MTETCALCGAEDVYAELTVPTLWVKYLRAERDFDAFGLLDLPLCSNCSAEVKRLKDETDRIDASFPQPDDLPERVTDALDRLDLDAIEGAVLE